MSIMNVTVGFQVTW